MNQRNRIRNVNQRSQRSLCASIEHFRDGEDQIAIDFLLAALDDLEQLLDADQYAEHPRLHPENTLQTIRTMYQYMREDDLVGLTDHLEFSFFPLMKEYLEGADETW